MGLQLIVEDRHSIFLKIFTRRYSLMSYVGFREIGGSSIISWSERDKKTNDIRQGLLGIGLWSRLRTHDLGWWVQAGAVSSVTPALHPDDSRRRRIQNVGRPLQSLVEIRLPPLNGISRKLACAYKTTLTRESYIRRNL